MLFDDSYYPLFRTEDYDYLIGSKIIKFVQSYNYFKDICNDC